ncbi:MAG TPA: hypothetical protein PKD86_00085 [Gemmatales bacterium]|nr:hypothetical protein [Gemmatales bacterium]
MNRYITVLIAVVVLAVLLSTATSQQPPTARRTVFSTLKIGQAVSLKEKAGLYEISTTDEGGPLTHKVVEVGDDYLVLRDEAGTVEWRIPVSAVRAVVHVTTKAK